MLIDTNVFIRMLSAPELLGKQTNRTLLIENLCVSIVSPYEVAIKQRIGKLEHFQELLDEAQSQSIEFIPITIGQLQIFSELTTVKHRDPFDLAIISLAIEQCLPLLTTDTILLDLKINGLQTIDARK